MKLIAHRGLTNGPNKQFENHPNQILKALSLGFDCEIDLWVIEGKLFLGHDSNQYPINRSYLEDNCSLLWIHAKNLEALLWLIGTSFTYFWHQNDDYTLTSNNYIWTYPGKPLTKNSICVLPELQDTEFNKMLNFSCYGICSDYVNIISPTTKVGMV